MIFVTVGTHEQPFDRLVRAIDRWKKDHDIQEEVVIQTGYSTYGPKYCEWQEFFTYKEMQEFTKKARIIISHGGPSSFIAPLQFGKIPIVVPRQKQYGEHVNDHQLEFCRAVAARQGNIIIVEDINRLDDVILGYDDVISRMPLGMQSNNKRFNEEFEKIVDELMKESKCKRTYRDRVSKDR